MRRRERDGNKAFQVPFFYCLSCIMVRRESDNGERSAIRMEK